MLLRLSLGILVAATMACHHSTVPSSALESSDYKSLYICVIDEKGQPLPDVSLQLTFSDGKELCLFTLSKGCSLFSSPRLWFPCSLVLSMPGYNTQFIPCVEPREEHDYRPQVFTMIKSEMQAKREP
jgi:hypothetical protein